MLKVTIKFIEMLLGTKTKKETFEKIVAQCKGEDLKKLAEELATLPEVDTDVEGEIDVHPTIFSRLDGVPGIWNYQVLGFFKDACRACGMSDGRISQNLTAYKTKIDRLIFVDPRFIPLQMPEGGELGMCVRPIRVETAQGPRTAIVASESAPVGTKLDLMVVYTAKAMKPYIMEWLAYGNRRGIGQWRNSGMGQFTFEYSELECTEPFKHQNIRDFASAPMSAFDPVKDDSIVRKPRRNGKGGAPTGANGALIEKLEGAAETAAK